MYVASMQKKNGTIQFWTPFQPLFWPLKLNALSPPKRDEIKIFLSCRCFPAAVAFSSVELSPRDLEKNGAKHRAGAELMDGFYD